MAATRRWPMKVGRNDPCPCGSRLKAKRCCPAKPTATGTPRAMLARMQHEVAPALAALGREHFRSLFNEMIYLPELDGTVQLRLPRVLTPEIDEAMHELSIHDDEGFDEALCRALPALDTPERRLDLAEAVLALRDRGLITPPLAAVAIIDLNQPDSALMLSALAEAIGVAAGEQETPSGLLIAAR
jgi:hypothetical protein